MRAKALESGGQGPGRGLGAQDLNQSLSVLVGHFQTVEDHKTSGAG